MNTSDKAKVLLRYGHSFQQILSDLNKVNEDGTHLDIDLQYKAQAFLILEQS